MELAEKSGLQSRAVHEGRRASQETCSKEANCGKTSQDYILHLTGERVSRLILGCLHVEEIPDPL